VKRLPSGGRFNMGALAAGPAPANNF